MTVTVAQIELAAVDPERVTPGLLGFLVVFALGLATWLLLRSMNRQLRKINFEEEPTGERPPTAEGPPTAEDRPERAAPPKQREGGRSR